MISRRQWDRCACRSATTAASIVWRHNVGSATADTERGLFSRRAWRADWVFCSLWSSSTAFDEFSSTFVGTGEIDVGEWGRRCDEQTKRTDADQSLSFFRPKRRVWLRARRICSSYQFNLLLAFRNYSLDVARKLGVEKETIAGSVSPSCHNAQ